MQEQISFVPSFFIRYLQWILFNQSIQFLNESVEIGWLCRSSLTSHEISLVWMTSTTRLLIFPGRLRNCHAPGAMRPCQRQQGQDYTGKRGRSDLWRHVDRFLDCSHTSTGFTPFHQPQTIICNLSSSCCDDLFGNNSSYTFHDLTA